MTHSKTKNAPDINTQTFNDFKIALLLVSLSTNAFILVTVLVAQASPVYAAQLSRLF
jgi:hypothetical protein